MSTQCTVFWSFFHLSLLVPCKTWCFQVNVIRIGSTDVKNTVCLLLKFCRPSINPWNVNWVHIRCDKCTRRNCSESMHCSWTEDRDCVLIDFGELGDKKNLVLMDQHNIELFSCCLRFLAFCSSTFHQTNAESSQNRSEDNLFISRIRSAHLLLEVDDHDEEEYSIFLPLGER